MLVTLWIVVVRDLNQKRRWLKMNKAEEILRHILMLHQTSQANAIYNYCWEELNKMGKKYRPKGHRTYG